MDDILSRYNDCRVLTKNQLELTVQKKKINEVYKWFEEHFVNSSPVEYITRCPIVIIQGPTGCGKTSTLKWVADELKLPIKEYSETTDVTSINFEMSRYYQSTEDSQDRAKLSQSIDRRKAQRFEHFVIDTIRYNPLPVGEQLAEPDADIEFDSDDDFVEIIPQPKSQPKETGVIIHIDTPLTFAKSQRILIQTLHKLVKMIRDISRQLRRRVAIVFETLEGDSETISLPTKIKLALRIQVHKFNPIIKTNMKKFIESVIADQKVLIFDKETIEHIVSDCDGDVRACINTLRLICNKSNTNALNRINYNSISGMPKSPLAHFQANKKQKLIHERARQIRLNPSLMRDNSRNLGFFHVLGKIFYQKRLYPESLSTGFAKKKPTRSVDRPYRTENSTEYLANMIDVEPKNLLAWLHQHYYRFCPDYDIDKAALFLENLSITDTTFINSTQSSQFYEAHNSLDQLQIHLAIESTVYSLYEDQSMSTKASHKKSHPVNGTNLVLRSSVGSSATCNGELYSFNKPVSMNLARVVEDHSALLNHCTNNYIGKLNCDSNKFLLDYAPYIRKLTSNWARTSKTKRDSYFPTNGCALGHPIYGSNDLAQVTEILDNMEINRDQDMEMRHEKLLEMIEELEMLQDKSIRLN